jgi:tetratricopeptide (TPR) repeat protein
VLGRDHPDTLSSIGNLANLYSDQEEYAKAQPLYEECLDTRSRVLGRDHPDTLTTIHNLSVFHMEQGRLDEALELAIRAKEGCESVFGEDHKELQEFRELVADIEEKRREANFLGFSPARLHADTKLLWNLQKACGHK